MKAREIFVWFNTACYNNRAWIVPMIEIILFIAILFVGYSKIPKIISKKFSGLPYDKFWIVFFTLVLAGIFYVMSS